MPWLTDLDRAVRASGLPVVVHPGWQTRGHRAMTAARGQVVHHTAGPRHRPGGPDYPSLAVVRDGRPGLPGPLSHLGLGRSGTVHVIAAGLSYHAGAWSWPGTTGNPDLIGIEAESAGDGLDWTPEQHWAYPVLCRALARWYRQPAALVVAHREGAVPRGRKIDPRGIDMAELRAIVSGAPAGPAPAGLRPPQGPPPSEDDMFEQRDRDRLAALERAVAGIPAAVAFTAHEPRKIDPPRPDGTAAPAGWSVMRLVDIASTYAQRTDAAVEALRSDVDALSRLVAAQAPAAAAETAAAVLAALRANPDVLAALRDAGTEDEVRRVLDGAALRLDV